MYRFLNNNRRLLGILFIGIVLRLLTAFFTNHIFDFINILALVRSVAETGDLAPGLSVLRRTWDSIQLYGKIYYQLPALWLHALEWMRLLDIKYILGNKAYTSPDSYLEGLNMWGVPLFQLTAIKMIQFVWDFGLLYGMVKIAEDLQIKERWQVVLAWALCPIILLDGYAIFMSDLAMTSMMTLGIWLWVKAYRQTGAGRIRYGALSIVALVTGAVIKQVPILLVPFLIISLSRSWKQVLIYIFVLIASYTFLSQYWTADGQLLKQFFLLSKESLAIFESSINGVSIFLFLYVLLLGHVLIYKKEYFRNTENIIYLAMVVLMVVYFSAVSTLLFIQFFVWMIPLAALIALKNPRLSWLYVLASLITMVRIVRSSDYMTTLMAPAIGAGFSDYIQYEEFYKKIINPILYHKVFTFIECVVFMTIGYSMYVTLWQKNFVLNAVFAKRKINFAKSVIGLFALYTFFFCLDYPIKARYISLLQWQNQIQDNSVSIGKNTLQVQVNNPSGQTIRTVDLYVKKQDVRSPDSLLLTFTDHGKTILRQKVSDFLFPSDTEKPYIIFLDKPVRSKSFTMTLEQEHKINTVAVAQTKVITTQNNKPGFGRYNGYDGFRDSERISLTYPKESFAVSFRGDYKWWYVFRALAFHFKQKPTFFLGYFGLIAGLMAVSFYLLFSDIKTFLTSVRRRLARE